MSISLQDVSERLLIEVELLVDQSDFSTTQRYIESDGSAQRRVMEMI